MNSIGLLLTRADLLVYCKAFVEELQRERKKLKELEWLRDHTPTWSPNFWSILARIRNTQEIVTEAKESLAVYKEQLDFCASVRSASLLVSEPVLAQEFPKMGTTSDVIIEKLNSLFTKIDESHQEVIEEISKCNTSLEIVQGIIDQLIKLEEKLDYIKTLPEKKEEKLKELVETLSKEKEKQVLLPKNTEKSVKSNAFKPLEKPIHAKFSMPNIEQSTDLTKISFERSKVLKGTKEVTRDVKMLSIFKKKKEVQLVNAEEVEFNEIENRVKDSTIPKFECRQIYKRGNLELLDNHQFKMLEFTTPANTGETDLLMITPSEVARAKEIKYKFMHIGAVQVGIKLLAREGIDCSALCVLQDNRISDFQISLLGALEASLCNQIPYFNCFPNFTTSIKDATHALRLRVKTDGIAIKEGMQELAIVYRVYYKLMSTTVEPRTKISNIPGITTGFITNPRNYSEQIKKVTWNEVTFPIEWKLFGPKFQPENAKAKSYQDKKTGNISLRFEGHRKSDVHLEELNKSLPN